MTPTGPIRTTPHQYWPAPTPAVRLAHAVLDRGKLLQITATREGGPECGPYGVPYYHWRWGRASVSLFLSSGRWVVLLESPAHDDAHGFDHGDFLYVADNPRLQTDERLCLFGRLRMRADTASRSIA